MGRRTRARPRDGAADRRGRTRDWNPRSSGDQHLTFAGGDHVGKRCQRLRVYERNGSADEDERMVMGAVGARGNPASRSIVNTFV